jgi:hypothetical protein
MSSQKVCEVTAAWPAEVFIQRHLEALLSRGEQCCVVACQQNTGYADSSRLKSLGAILRVARLPTRQMPLIVQLLSLCRGLRTMDMWDGTMPLKRLIQLAFFRRIDPTLIHFHTAQLAAGLGWIPQKLGVPYTVSLRGWLFRSLSSVCVHAAFPPSPCESALSSSASQSTKRQ